MPDTALTGATLAPQAAAEDPTWFKDAIIYQLHVKSFFDANNDGVGDFRGLMEKLDYIAELGVTAIWLLPFYPSPRRDDGYDIGDYRGVHADYGTLADARAFVQGAHERGLKVITELVINHTSDQHPWFQRARTAPKDSPERDFYVWSDSDEKYAGTRIIFTDTEKSNWTWDEVAGQYYWHRFFSHQPDLNFDNPAVMEEVLSVMRFWLDMGIDGLRLDAVPYLVEREGTNNENLPETHALLKKIRAEMDIHAPGRMLLAEANQWPEDAQVYFGEGDECHMSFHFPLMPRMYMAIAREDRFPITDIMRQTPEIPANCQWAVFLRNHDELTLEMVTSGERDYLWETYAADRRARLNLGIRRRLSPLLQRDRRRIELMNGLLLSMPGTPVIYYGDELGMGDNIFIGDRDGVRTPMQWSVDRNGGFSRADPAKLVLPPIMDPIYGFQAVNVEAQASDPYSLLNWMRRMLAVRAGHKAFGRGTQRFLYPGNRKVLAYLREHTLDDGTEETLLCVSNLSRSAQAVELDLSAFSGRVPVDIVGGSVFPAVGQLSYLLTLPPFAFYWFLLANDAQLPTWHTPQPEALPEFSTIVLRSSIEEVRPGYGRTVLENEALPAYLPKRRWFASKTETLTKVTIAYFALINPVPEPIFMTEVEVTLGERKERYALPMGVVWEDEAVGNLPAQLAMARVRLGPRVGYLTDAFTIDSFTRAVLRNLRNSDSVSFEGGRLDFRPTSLMAKLDLAEDAEIRRLSAEQSNSSLIVGDTLVMKVVRRVAAGVHPEGEITRYLTERGFGNTAPLYGEIVRVDPDGTPNTIGLVQGFVRNQGDGWGWTLEFLERTVDELSTTDGEAEHEEDALASYNVFAAAIGQRLGELHAVFSAPTSDPAFSPEPADDAVLAEFAAGAIEQIDLALDMLAKVTDWPSAEAEARAKAILGHADGLREAARKLAMDGKGSLRTRVHGDFHLGQVLVVQSDAYLIDFEGEPARTMEQRRAKSSPIRDVAGCLRSFDYAAAAALPGRVATAPAAAARRAEILQHFRIGAEAAFLAAYRAVLAEAPNKWVTPAGEAAMLDLFLLEKAAYEIRYEAANRPTWIGIPLEGMYVIAARLLNLPPEGTDA
ncbi:maltose alpha-D-glucosyltransferase [Acidisphaera sp. L21]|uniref:maltose alpha-D-glucosyltransferase n=1 Tax=Acidisphaera sp. L21 TaxID=1641851 RepID=UPI00131CDF8E|nr:maltose alpha-D-glucosyltransferase [Acidisphaera sp. L21]